MKFSKRRLLLAGVVAGLSAVSGAGVAIASQPAQQSLEPTERDLSLSDYSFAAGAGDVAALPTDMDVEALGGLDPASARLLLVDGDATYWSALDEYGQLCLVLGLTPDQSYSSSCAFPEQFEERGIPLQSYGPTTAAEGYLLPDGVVTGENLLVTDPLASVAPDTLLRSSGNNTFTAVDLQAPAAEDLPPAFQ
jgi:hypothetical protein